MTSLDFTVQTSIENKNRASYDGERDEAGGEEETIQRREWKTKDEGNNEINLLMNVQQTLSHGTH